MAVAAKGEVVVLLLLLLLVYYIEYGVLLVSSNSVVEQRKCPFFEQEMDALLGFFNNVKKKKNLVWNKTSRHDWEGVGCDVMSRVTSLRLPAKSLIGQIPNNTIGTMLLHYAYMFDVHSHNYANANGLRLL